MSAAPPNHRTPHHGGRVGDPVARFSSFRIADWSRLALTHAFTISIIHRLRSHSHWSATDSMSGHRIRHGIATPLSALAPSLPVACPLSPPLAITARRAVSTSATSEIFFSIAVGLEHASIVRSNPYLRREKSRCLTQLVGCDRDGQTAEQVSARVARSRMPSARAGELFLHLRRVGGHRSVCWLDRARSPQYGGNGRRSLGNPRTLVYGGRPVCLNPQRLLRRGHCLGSCSTADCHIHCWRNFSALQCRTMALGLLPTQA
jgi:hypothetical protein